MAIRSLKLTTQVKLLITYVLMLNTVALITIGWLWNCAQSTAQKELISERTAVYVDKIKAHRIKAWRKALKYTWSGNIYYVHGYSKDMYEFNLIMNELKVHLGNEPRFKIPMWSLSKDIEEIKALADGASQELLSGNRNSYIKYQDKVIDLMFRIDQGVDSLIAEQNQITRAQSISLVDAVSLAALCIIGSIIFNSLIVCGYLYRLKVQTNNNIKSLHKTALQFLDGEVPEVKDTAGDYIKELKSVFVQASKASKEINRKHQLLIDNAAEVICSIGKNGTFINISPFVEESWGYSQSELIGMRLFKLVHHKDRNESWQSFNRSRQSSKKQVFENRIFAKSGELIDLRWSIYWCPLENSFFCVTQNITSQKLAERERQKMIELVGHDLKLPLNAVQQSFEIIESATNLPTLCHRTLNRAKASTTEMIRLVSDLLDAEKVKEGRLVIEKESIDLKSIVDDAIDNVKHLAENKKNHIVLDLSASEVLCDRARMIQVLVNLLSNAVKYSPAGSIIKISARKKHSSIELSVIDQGRGITETNLEKIFHRYEQNEVSDKSTGTGLGLYICRKLIELHDGSITVESKYGKGSIFTVSIPDSVEILSPGLIALSSTSCNLVSHNG